MNVIYKENCNLWSNANFYLLTMLHIENLLLNVNALILHSCYMEYKNQAILFTAPSGTGKTTQGNIWKKIYNSKIINGDKCILQKMKDNFMACGFFLHGSAKECENYSIPIKAIVIVRQSPIDYIEELDIAKKVSLLYTEITVNNWNNRRIFHTLNLLEELVQRTTVIMLHCTMKDSAAYTLHHYLYGD